MQIKSVHFKIFVVYLYCEIKREIKKYSTLNYFSYETNYNQ